MKKTRVYYDKEMDTLDIWFDEPPQQGFSREIQDGVILKYDENGNVAGVEILFLSKQEKLPEEIKIKVKESIEFTNVIKAIA